MATVELMVSAFLKIIFAVIGAYVVIGKINPMIGTFMDGAINDEKATRAFLYLLNAFIIVFAAELIINILPQLNLSSIQYFQTIDITLKVIEALFNYIQWILLAIIVVFGLKYLKKD